MKTIPFKQWLYEEAQRVGKSVACIIKRFYAGQYPNLKIERLSKRTVNVIVEE